MAPGVLDKQHTMALDLFDLQYTIGVVTNQPHVILVRDSCRSDCYQTVIGGITLLDTIP